MNHHISSPEFSALCQSQISLLSKGLGAVWTVIYLTDNMSEGGQGKLFPFAINPQQGDRSFRELPPIELSEIWRSSQSQFMSRLLPKYLLDRQAVNTTEAESWRLQTAESKQVILPLVHQETFIGLLVTGRSDREWQSNELQQIEDIVRTISIARFFEIQYHWSQEDLAVQENLRRIEHDRLDNLLHQLRNPLTAIRTFGKLVLKRILPNDRNHPIVQNIIAQSDRFQELLEQFEAESQQLPAEKIADHSLTLLATERHNIDRSSFLLPSSVTELDSVDLIQILTPLLNTAEAIALEREIELVNYLPEALPLVTGNFEALREILNNLIDNALKYTPKGGEVKLSCRRRQPNYLGIAIEDTGVGIPEADQPRIFERHYRGVQAQGDIPGTGLGLSIAKELALKMQGDIELISPNEMSGGNAGTTFIIWLLTMDNGQGTVDN
ncbi:MAG: HAMP domain-containing sensor histidine kinase [Cyanobacteria bacterium J06600_6]